VSSAKRSSQWRKTECSRSNCFKNVKCFLVQLRPWSILGLLTKIWSPPHKKIKIPVCIGTATLVALLTKKINFCLYWDCDCRSLHKKHKILSILRLRSWLHSSQKKICLYWNCDLGHTSFKKYKILSILGL